VVVIEFKRRDTTGSAGEMAAPLISVEDLAFELRGWRRPALLDVRWPIPGPPDRAGYLAGHIPGARFVDLDADLSAPPGGADGGNHPLPTPEAFTAAMRRHGVRQRDVVVVYDGGSGLAAARAWWCLRYFGHHRVSLLDGGFAAWAAAGLPVDSGEREECALGDFTADPGHLPTLDADGAARLGEAGLLFDARSAARYRGEDTIDRVRGHIPGAFSAPTTGNVDANGHWLPAAELTERYAGLGVGGHTVGVYCGSGVTACHSALALTLTGAATPALYVGSWSEWSAQGRPVEV
jgi:thiosulfate/3-mercaptopyruvate sulfurtransferase